MISKLVAPVRCSLFVAWMRQCGVASHWQVNGEFVCDEHLQDMADGAGFNDEDVAFLQGALDEIAQRRSNEVA